MPSPAGNRTIKDMNDMIDNLRDYAEDYIEQCLDSKKQVATSKGAVDIKYRHVPTIEFFLNIWLPRNVGNTITKQTYYRWLRGEDDVKKSIIKDIDEQFKALAGDIVANEGNGVFYAKNKLGWSDKMQSDSTFSFPILNIDPLNDSIDHITQKNIGTQETD